MLGKISILMPTFNCEKYIINAIQSVLWQTYEYFELIVIDDGSTDNTSSLVKKVKDKRIQYVRIEHSGISNALNFGLKIAKHDWIARMDADDLSLPNRLVRQINFIENNSSYDVVSSWYVTFRSTRICHLFKLPVDHKKIVQGLELHSTLCHPGTMFRKQLVLSIGGYSNHPFEDYDLWLRLRQNAKFYNIPEPLILVRLREDSLFRKDLIKKKTTMIYLQNKHFNNQKDFLNFNHNLINKDKLKGWREWFYGDKYKARTFWSNNFLNLFTDFRTLAAFILTYLPKKYFENIKNLNIRARINKFLVLNRQNRKKIQDYINRFNLL